MPPPTINWSTLSASDSKIESLVETFDPPTIATSGRLGANKARPRASSSACSRGPAQAVGANCAIPWVVASARCAVPKASFTYTSHKAAIFLDNSGSFFFSPLLTRQFSSKTTCPGCTWTPSTQFCTRLTGIPSNSESRLAMGAKESSAVSVPSVGRPR